MQEKIKILKVRFNKVTLKQATDLALKWAKDSHQHYITTPNPEILLEAQKNSKFLKILNQSDLNIPDGTGILWAAKYLSSIKSHNSKLTRLAKWLISLMQIPSKKLRSVLPERVTGTDLMKEICKNSNSKIFLLGAAPGIAEQTAEKLKKTNPSLKIAGTWAGSPATQEEKEICEKINNSQAEILFVAYGAPQQELWIARNLKKLETVKLAIGIGGAFDFIAEKRKRSPKWMQHAGLEWLYRLLQEPKRISRIANATLKFPTKVLKKALKS